MTEPVAPPDEPVVDLTHRKSSRIIVIVLAVVGLVVAGVVGYIVLRTPPISSPSAEDKRALADEACPRLMLSHTYRVTKNGKTSYLLGTRHAGVSLSQFPEAVQQAFRDATVAVFESDIDRPQAGRASSASVSELLGPELWDRYRELVGDEVAKAVEHGPVSRATASLTLLYEDTSRALDVELLRSARAVNKRVIVLEDDADSSHLTETYLGLDALRMFIKAVHRQSELAGVVRAMLGQYCHGGSEIGEQLDKALNGVTAQRTRDWVPKLLPILAEGGAFVAVGQQHVEGSTNLIALLRIEGFDVHPVR